LLIDAVIKTKEAINAKTLQVFREQTSFTVGEHDKNAVKHTHTRTHARTRTYTNKLNSSDVNYSDVANCAVMKLFGGIRVNCSCYLVLDVLLSINPMYPITTT